LYAISFTGPSDSPSEFSPEGELFFARRVKQCEGNCRVNPYRFSVKRFLKILFGRVIKVDRYCRQNPVPELPKEGTFWYKQTFPDAHPP
jgi:hypothetical protein